MRLGRSRNAGRGYERLSNTLERKVNVLESLFGLTAFYRIIAELIRMPLLDQIAVRLLNRFQRSFRGNGKNLIAFRNIVHPKNGGSNHEIY